MDDGIEVGRWIKTKTHYYGKVVSIIGDEVTFSIVEGLYPNSVQFTGELMTRLRVNCKLICKPNVIHNDV